MKLIGIDLDGTLLNSKQEISEKNIESLKKLDSDMFPFICSGRDVRDILNILKQAKLDIPAVGLNGAIAFDQDKLLFEYFFDSETVKNIEKIILNYPTKVYTNKGSFESENYKEQLKVVFDKIGEEYDRSYLQYELDYEKTIVSSSFKKLSDLLDISDCSIYKIFVFVPNSKLKSEIQHSLTKVSTLNVTESAPTNLEILPAHVSKGNVFQILEELFEFEDSIRIAIGDSLNDLSLFEEAEYAYAMGNAHEELKKIATTITADHDNNGVSEALLHISSKIRE